MPRIYRKRGQRASQKGAQLVDKAEVLGRGLTVELPISLGEVIHGVSEEVERLAGQAGRLIMQQVLEAEVATIAGPKGQHNPQREATRWGSQGGYGVLAGKKVRLQRPRVRDPQGREVALASYRRFQSAPRRQRSIFKKLIHGISTRHYEKAIEDFTDGYGVSRSAVSREVIRGTRGALQALCERRIDELGRLAVLMIDGKPIKGECVVVALGVDAAGNKHILGLVQGSTENSTVVGHLLEDLVERGLDTRQPMLMVIDGSKALRKAVKRTFGDRCPVQRCHLHKRRNLAEYLPKGYQGSADQRVRTAYAMTDYAPAQAQLFKTVAWLEGINPSAAASLREGLEETLTLHRLGIPEALRKSLQSTNLIESALSVAEDVTGRVKRWRRGDMRLRWTAAGLLMAEQQFRRVRGHKRMAKLVAALDGQAGQVAEPSAAA